MTYDTLRRYDIKESLLFSFSFITNNLQLTSHLENDTLFFPAESCRLWKIVESLRFCTNPGSEEKLRFANTSEETPKHGFKKIKKEKNQNLMSFEKKMT